MVVWRSLVSRTVYLHTGTMGVHRACFYRLGSESHSPGAESPRKIVSLSCAAFLLSRTNWRAPGNFLGGGVFDLGPSFLVEDLEPGAGPHAGLQGRPSQGGNARGGCRPFHDPQQ